MFEMRFFPFENKMLLQDWPTLPHELFIGSEIVQRINHYIYNRTLVSTDGTLFGEISTWIQKAGLVFANLRVSSSAVPSVLLCGCETWALRVEVFDRRCLGSVARVFCDHRVGNAQLKNRVLGRGGKSTDELVNFHQLR